MQHEIGELREFQGADWNSAEQAVRQRDRFLDDLLNCWSPFPELLERAGRLGVRLGVAYTVIVLPSDSPYGGSDDLVLRLEQSLRMRFATSGCLVGRYAGDLVILVPVGAEPAKDGKAVGHGVAQVLKSQRPYSHRQMGIGRSRLGVHGIRVSYEEARETLEILAATGIESLDLSDSGVLLHRVLTRDRAAITDLVRAVLLPLTEAYGGPEPLLDTLEAYFRSNCTATRAAYALHLSVRAVTYRLGRIRLLTGHDVNVPEERFALETARRGARVIRWPEQPLPDY
jgi:sugar diacid utilization regulator